MVEFKKIADHWFASKKILLKPSSVSAYHTIVYSNLIPYFQNRKISDKTVQEYIIERTKKGNSKRTVQDHIKILVYILKEGEQNGLCKSQVFNINYPTSLNSRKRETKAFPVDAIKKLRKFLIHNSDEDKYNLAILVSLSLGLRIGEVTGLKYSDFNYDTGILSVSRTSQRVLILDEENKIARTHVAMGTPKTKSSARKLPVPQAVLDIIKKHHESSADAEYIFLGKRTKKPMDNRTLRNVYYNVLEKLNLPKLTFHALRHSFASNCIASDIDVKTTSSMLGHSDIKMTLEIYTHPSFEQQKAAVNKLGKLFG